jgi:RNA polymerase sigma factor (sigma-70 family)
METLRLTDQERQFAEEKINLVYGFLWRYFPKYVSNEDVVQDLFVSYLKSIKKFKKEKAKFSTYVYIALRNAIYLYYRDIITRDKKFRGKIISLNQFVQEPYIFSYRKKEMEEIICEPNAENYDNIIDTNDTFNKLKDKVKEMNNKYKLIFYLLYLGYPKKEIAEILGISSSSLSRDIRKIKDIANQIVKSKKYEGGDRFAS